MPTLTQFWDIRESRDEITDESVAERLPDRCHLHLYAYGISACAHDAGCLSHPSV